MKQKLAIAPSNHGDRNMCYGSFNGFNVDSVENIRDLLKSLNKQEKQFLTSH